MRSRLRAHGFGGALHGPDGWFEIRWTEDILVETLYHLRKNNPGASDRQIGGVRDKFIESFSGGRITGYQIDPDIDYPDIFDAHVHAAAIHAGVDFVITADRDFSELDEVLDGLAYEVHSPDSFFCLLDDSSPRSIRLVLNKQLDYWSRREGQFNLCTQLVNAGAPQFAERVRAHLRTIDSCPEALPPGTLPAPDG